VLQAGRLIDDQAIELLRRLGGGFAPIGAADLGRWSSQPRLLLCRSTLTKSMAKPALAKAWAKLVPIVVLPQPPFVLMTRIETVTACRRTRARTAADP
jgi:hypothetical protein